MVDPKVLTGFKLLSALFLLLYPLWVFLGLRHLGPAATAALLIPLLLGRYWLMRTGRVASLGGSWLLPAALILLLGSLLLNSDWGLRLYPVLMNLSFLTLFAFSLRHPPSVVERLAALREPVITPAARAYMRKVTWAWCLFFGGNASLALATVLLGSIEVWTLYNGLLAYLLMGLMFGLELLIRRRVRARHG